MPDLSASDARRIALRAQGFGERRPGGADIRAVRRILGRVKTIQIDTVNVLARTQYLPVFSRVGPYQRPILNRLAYDKHELIESWAHMASFATRPIWPLLEWRRSTQDGAWTRFAEWARGESAYIEGIYRQVAERGPLSAADLDGRGERRGGMWGGSLGNNALAWLFTTGRIVVATRRNVERFYDLTERVLPAELLAAQSLAPDDQKRRLLLEAADALGVATGADLSDYFRMSRTKPLLDGLVADGLLERVRVEGWRDVAYIRPDTRVPRRIDATALLSPFDSLIWERKRTERMFGFHYRIEIYVPAPKRTFGYYVLPFLMDEEIVARVDLKSDRKGSALLVQSAFGEDGIDRDVVADRLAGELATMAGWLGLERIVVARKGNLAPRLAKAVRR
jgi:uncharacterized protein